jgi:hypothetical protein
MASDALLRKSERSGPERAARPERSAGPERPARPERAARPAHIGHGHVGESDPAPAEGVDETWRQSLLAVMRQVIHSLPDQTTLGELVAATRANPHLAPMLGYMSVQELIDMAVARPTYSMPIVPKPTNGVRRRVPEPAEIEYDEDGNPLMELPDAGPAVIRRRADIPDGDFRILRSLTDEGPLSEPSLLRATKMTSEQLKLLLRHLRTKGWIHIEGSGPKRKIKVTRNGTSHLRKLGRKRV